MRDANPRKSFTISLVASLLLFSLFKSLVCGLKRSQDERYANLLRCIMPALGAKRQYVIGKDGNPLDVKAEVNENVVAVAYGKYYPEFWVQLPKDKKEPSAGNGTHIAFNCSSQAQVNSVYDNAIEAGGTCNGKPGPRPEYSEKYPYYGAFFLDPCGNKLEATFVDIGMLKYCTIL